MPLTDWRQRSIMTSNLCIHTKSVEQHRVTVTSASRREDVTSRAHVTLTTDDLDAHARMFVPVNGVELDEAGDDRLV